jgi:hypothetical protein
MPQIKFTEDFANRKKGDVWNAPLILANRLVAKRKVAVFVDKATQDAVNKAASAKAPEKKVTVEAEKPKADK